MDSRHKLKPEQRRFIYNKMGGRCAYCGEALAYEDMQVDHVVPLRGFDDSSGDVLENMLPACRSCNHYKRGNTLEGWRKRYLKRRRQLWHETVTLTVRLYGLAWSRRRLKR